MNNDRHCDLNALQLSMLLLHELLTVRSCRSKPCQQLAMLSYPFLKSFVRFVVINFQYFGNSFFFRFKQERSKELNKNYLNFGKTDSNVLLEKWSVNISIMVCIISAHCCLHCPSSGLLYEFCIVNTVSINSIMRVVFYPMSIACLCVNKIFLVTTLAATQAYFYYEEFEDPKVVDYYYSFLFCFFFALFMYSSNAAYPILSFKTVYAPHSQAAHYDVSV